MQGLQEELRARLEAGKAAWPAVAVDPVEYARHLAVRSGEGLPSPERAADLYIACGCVLGASRALEAFCQRFRPVVARAIARTDSSQPFLDEVMQALAVKLFVRTSDGPPLITQYAGRSSLPGWLSTAAKRTALNMRRRKDDRGHQQGALEVNELEEADPELLLLKARYKPEFEEAIRAALTSLPARQRSLLLLQSIEGLTLPQLATMHRVSRATIARRLASAREALFEGTRNELMGRLQLSDSEYESLVALVRSQLELTLSTIAT
jgi:RNA polymerase sigma-70 factor (ECF subfamily)